MERGLSVDVSAVNVDFVVVDEGDDVVDITVLDRVEQDVAAHLLHSSNHFVPKMN